MIAVGALAAMKDLGFKVPDDVAMVSFDDIPENLTSDSFFTVVKQPSYELGKKATELLISRIKADREHEAEISGDHFPSRVH